MQTHGLRHRPDDRVKRLTKLARPQTTVAGLDSHDFESGGWIGEEHGAEITHLRGLC
jgi:hypothetical protein